MCIRDRLRFGPLRIKNFIQCLHGGTQGFVQCAVAVSYTHLGAPFVAAVGDVCATSAFAREDLAALAAQQLNALAQKVSARLGLTLSAGADVRDYVAARCSKEKGAAGLAECCDKMFRALSEYLSLIRI